MPVSPRSMDVASKRIVRTSVGQQFAHHATLLCAPPSFMSDGDSHFHLGVHSLRHLQHGTGPRKWLGLFCAVPGRPSSRNRVSSHSAPQLSASLAQAHSPPSVGAQRRVLDLLRRYLLTFSPCRIWATPPNTALPTSAPLCPAGLPSAVMSFLRAVWIMSPTASARGSLLRGLGMTLILFPTHLW